VDPPAVAEVFDTAPVVDHISSDVTPVGSHDNSSASPSPSPPGSDRRGSDEDVPTPPEVVATEPAPLVLEKDDSPTTPAPPRETFSAADGVDPFGTLPMKLNEKIHVALQHALQIYQYSGNNYKLAMLPRRMKAGINQFPIKDVVHQSVFQQHHLYSLLAAMSIRMKHIFGHNMSGEDPLIYRAKAVYHLRNELIRSSRVGQVDKHTILDMLFLSVSEMAHGNYEASRKHLIIVGKLYHILDSREHFDFWIGETAAHVDNQLALLTGERPVLPFSFDPGTLLPERMAALKRELRHLVEQELSQGLIIPSPTALVIASPPRGLKDAVADLAATLDLRMGTKFEWGLKVGVFDTKMSRIINDLVDCVAIAKVVWRSPHAVCFDAEWLCRKARSVLRALLALAPENNIGPMDLLGKCMEGARLSLLIMMSHACTMIGFQTARMNAQRLRNAVAFAMEFWCPVVGLSSELTLLPGRTLDNFSEIQISFILFTMMVGVWSSEIADAPEIEKWFFVRSVNICRLLRIRNYFQLREHLISFLLSTTLQEASMRKVAAALE
jgi:hypothetical protein